MLTLLFADVLVLFFDLIIIALFGVGFIYLADYLKRRRDYNFLCGLNQILNKEETEKKTDE